MELILYDDLIKEIDKEIDFYKNSDHSHDFEKWCNEGAEGALQSLKQNVYKLKLMYIGSDEKK